MPLRLLGLCALLALSLLASASRCDVETQHQLADTAPPGASAGANSQQAQLRWGDGKLELVTADKEPQLLPAIDPLPYRIVRRAKPALLTTIGADLIPCTYALGAGIQAYPDMLPVIADGPLIALMSADIQEDAPGKLLLLNSEGAVGWEAQGGELIWPRSRQDFSTAFVAIASVDQGLIYQLGSAPELAAVDSTTLKERWRVSLGARFNVAAVDAYAIGAKLGLLSLQYDYTAFEFLLIDPRDGRILRREMLEGQPVSRAVFPGPTFTTEGAVISQDSLSVLVFFESRELQRWTFDTLGGEVSKARAEGAATAPLEENPNPPGESRLAGQPALPQRLLPAEAGDAWRVPAMLDAQGRVFVADKQSFGWRNAEDAAS